MRRSPFAPVYLTVSLLLPFVPVRSLQCPPLLPVSPDPHTDQSETKRVVSFSTFALDGEGFHRQVKTKLKVSPSKATDTDAKVPTSVSSEETCDVFLFFTLPKGAFADPDELRHLSLLSFSTQTLSSSSSPHVPADPVMKAPTVAASLLPVDIEIPSKAADVGCVVQTVRLPVSSPTTVEVEASLPVHLRYQDPSVSSAAASETENGPRGLLEYWKGATEADKNNLRVEVEFPKPVILAPSSCGLVGGPQGVKGVGVGSRWKLDLSSLSLGGAEEERDLVTGRAGPLGKLKEVQADSGGLSILSNVQTEGGGGDLPVGTVPVGSLNDLLFVSAGTLVLSVLVPLALAFEIYLRVQRSKAR
uniref:Uncharacterized protein n=1 Tax=Chromera velia CCMP2878 TaxID=1169474 RepID=A0A0G4FSX0_9ALVE|eukprot:Cvel_3685.t1-p1 / transcript=Cvel_3685.t1 / gene=Cvel_3685 / organism=Chromera_velia_CCMP2878 / gene_product=hypothetical protein / transcript_product=hypothetical protein / location=Cvel_scaffold153:37988-39064(-) / protein_length=359 / sequence_SO=supercontig / SO=protein_coding / is_pseudo=false